MPTKSQSIQVSVSDNSLMDNSYWVKIEQENILSQAINLTDLLQMYSMSMSGQSAMNYLDYGCDATSYEDGSLEVIIKFFAWPSDPSLELTATLSIGEIINSSNVMKDKEFDLVIPLQKEIDLPYYMESAKVIEKTKFFNAFGLQVAEPSYDIIGSKIYFDQEVFGVIRIKGVAKGTLYTASLLFNDTYNFTTNSKNKITNIKETAIIDYVAEDGAVGKTQEELDIPPCVLALLEYCEDTGEKKISNASVDHNEYRTLIYFSTCTGGILLVDKEKI